MDARRYPYSPTLLPKSTGDSLLKTYTVEMSRGYSADEVRAAVFIPKYYPPVTSAAVATDGSLWVRLAEGGSSFQYRVISRAGDIIARLTLPSNTTIMAVAGDNVHAVNLDEFDVPTVFRYRIAR